MSDLNQVTMTGRVGADPEIRRTQAGSPIANLRLAVTETWRDSSSGERKEKTEWASVVCFSEGLCKVIEAHVKKGDKILVQGKMQTRKWQDQSGNDRYSTEVVMQGFDAKLIMLGSPNRGSDDRDPSPSESAAQNSPQRPYREDRSYMDDMSDSDIPF